MSVASVKAVPNAPIAVAKAMAPEAMKAGASAGRMTSRMTRQGRRRARGRPLRELGSSFSTAAMMVRITRGMEK